MRRTKKCRVYGEGTEYLTHVLRECERIKEEITAEELGGGRQRTKDNEKDSFREKEEVGDGKERYSREERGRFQFYRHQSIILIII